MKWLKSVFGDKQEEPEAPAKGLFGLQLGCAVELNSLDFRVLGDQLLLEFPGETQLIEAVGEIDLGAGSRIKRYYTSDDAILQIHYSGAEQEQNVEDVLLFVYDKSIHVAGNLDWKAWLAPDKIGPKLYQYRDKAYQRSFFADSEGNVEPIAMSEQIENRAGERYGLDNFSMLFEREITAGVSEMLLVNAEESDDDRLVTIALGVHLTPSQFNVVS